MQDKEKNKLLNNSTVILFKYCIKTACLAIIVVTRLHKVVK